MSLLLLETGLMLSLALPGTMLLLPFEAMANLNVPAAGCLIPVGLGMVYLGAVELWRSSPGRKVGAAP